MKKPKELATTSAVEIEFHGDKVKWTQGILADRVALDSEGHLLFASIVTDATQFKGIRGVINTNKKVEIKSWELEVKRKDHTYPAKPSVIVKHPTGYTDHTFRLPYRKVHAFVMAKTVGFLIDASEPHLWKLLMSERYSTPLLREWLPWITQEMIEKKFLVPARCFNCECATINMGTTVLDEIVSRGVREGHLAIPGRFV